MDQFLKSLRTRRAVIQDRIDAEQARPVPDSLKLQALKKLRFGFKEQIEFIERLNRSGDLKMIPVVRRRALAPAVLSSRS